MPYKANHILQKLIIIVYFIAHSSICQQIFVWASENIWSLARTAGCIIINLQPCTMYKYREMFPNLRKLVSAALAIPVTNTDCERRFSTQNRIKRAHHSSLGTKRLDVLMRISIKGPPNDQFDFETALTFWRKSSRKTHP